MALPAEPGRWAGLVLPLLLGVQLIACQGTIAQPRTLPLDILFSGTQCTVPGEGFSARWLRDRESVAEVLAELRRGALLRAGEGGAVAPGPALLLTMGAQSSAGYGLALGSGTATMDGETATVRVQVSRPAPGSINAAVMTRPCLLVHLPPGSYQRVRVVDSEGRVLAAVATYP